MLSSLRFSLVTVKAAIFLIFSRHKSRSSNFSINIFFILLYRWAGFRIRYDAIQNKI